MKLPISSGISFEIGFLIKLGELGEKIINCTDEKKKARHIVGFRLGYTFVCTMVTIFAEAENVLGEINAKINGKDFIGEEEIPF